MKYTQIAFTIKAEKEFNGVQKEHEIEFTKEFDENNECTDGMSFNITSGWTYYTGWHQGWTELDPDLEELLTAIREYSTSMECEQLIAEMEITDINYEKEIKYHCTDYLDEVYTFIVICTDIEEVEY